MTRLMNSLARAGNVSNIVGNEINVSTILKQDLGSLTVVLVFYEENYIFLSIYIEK